MPLWEYGKMVSVVVTTHNRAFQIKNLIWSVFEYGDRKPDEMCVVDDASTDNTAEVLGVMASVYPIIFRRRDREEYGWQSPSIPRNMAIRLSKGDDIVFTEPEMIWTKKTLSKLLEYRKSPDEFVNIMSQGFVGRPLVDNEWKNPEGLWGGNIVYRRTDEMAARCLLATREMTYKVTGYDEGFRNWGYDDISFIMRLQLAGYKMVRVTDVPVLHQWHEAPPASGALADINLARMQEQERNGIYAVNYPTWGTDNGKYPYFGE